MTSVELLFGVHAHQPAGNFPAVLDDAHERCYRPFIHTLHRYPEFRFAIHFSGWLIEYLEQRFPDDIALLAEMVARDQVEVFGGGDYEPVLAAIPAQDRVGQLERLNERMRRTLGARVQGAWLTERVWDATVISALVRAGMRYVTVDDYHFLCAGREAAELDGYFTTEEGGNVIDLFPISEALRYRIPFSTAPEAVALIEGFGRRQRGVAAVYFDDIEKFGIWPETHAWVYGQRWLEQFIEAVLASGRIAPVLFRDYHARHGTRGIVYLPTTSYIEMNGWSLPAAAAERFSGLAEELKRANRFTELKPFVRGGIWLNFLSRYPEANWMHKRMLGLSARMQALDPAQRSPALVDLLYRAQANDAYWHGLFGGLYLPHLRRTLWHALLRLEAELDRLSPVSGADVVDLDHDGARECFLRSPAMLVVVRLDPDAALAELSSFVLAHNFGDTLRRYREHYHARVEIRHGPLAGEIEAARTHDPSAYKHVIDAADLVPDSGPRAIFLDGFELDGERVAPAYRVVTAGASGAQFDADVSDVRVHKAYRLVEDGVEVRYRIGAGLHGSFGTELNLALPSSDGFGGRYALGDAYPCGFGQVLELGAMQTLALEDSALGGRVCIHVSSPAMLDARPHVTVSQSEAGFEKIMQAACLRLGWRLDGQARELAVTLRLQRLDGAPS